MKRVLSSLILIASLSACSGGSSTPNAGTSPPKSPSYATISASVVIPGSAQTTSAKLRRIYSQVASTQGISFIVFPHGTSSASAIVTTAADISSTTSTLCSPSGTGRTCTVSFQAPAVSTNDILVQTWDQKPSGGTIPGTAHVLSAQTLPNQTITSGVVNSVALTLNPVIASLNITTTPKLLHTLLPATFTINVLAYDAAQDIILSGNYVDINGNPVSLNLSSSDSSVTIAPTSVSSSGTVVIGTYNGQAYAPANGVKTVTITESGSFGGSFSLGIAGATVTTYSLNHAVLPPNATNYYGAAYVNVAGNDPQIWTVDTDPSVYGGIERYDVASHTVTYTGGFSGYTLEGGLAVTGPSAGNTVYAGGTTFPYSWTYAPSLGSLSNATCSVGTGGSCAPVTSNIVWNNGLNIYWVSGGTLQAYSTSMSITSAISSAIPTTIAGMDVDGSGDFYMADAGTSNEVWTFDAGNSTVYHSPVISNGVFDLKIYSGIPFVSFGSTNGFGGVSTTPMSPTLFEGLFTSLGHPTYLYADNSTPGGLYGSEIDSSGNLSLMRYLIGSRVSEAPLGLTFPTGAPGPVTGLPDGSKIYMVAYTSTGGTLIEVTP